MAENLSLQLIFNRSQILYFFILFLSQSHAAACAARVCVFSVCWYEDTRACHNTLLVFCGQEEPGSAPVTQLLTALVLPFGLTSSTCLLILRLCYSLSALWNVFSEASQTKIYRQTLVFHNLISSLMNIYNLLHSVLFCRDVLHV